MYEENQEIPKAEYGSKWDKGNYEYTFSINNISICIKNFRAE